MTAMLTHMRSASSVAPGRYKNACAELMRHALTQALRRVHIGPKKLKLDGETRWQIAGEAIEELRRQ